VVLERVQISNPPPGARVYLMALSAPGFGNRGGWQAYGMFGFVATIYCWPTTPRQPSQRQYEHNPLYRRGEKMMPAREMSANTLCPVPLALVAISAALASCAASNKTIPRTYVVTFPEVSSRSASPAYVIDSSVYHFSAMTLAAVTAAHGDVAPGGWARYIINRAGVNPERTESREMTASEANLFRINKMRLVPIVAPDQGRLSGAFGDGYSLALETVAVLNGIIEGFGSKAAAQEVLVFLDVEGDRYPLSEPFLLGWCSGVRKGSTSRIVFLPAVYTNAGVSAGRVRQIIASAHHRCQLSGLWLASYLGTPEMPPKWRDMYQDMEQHLTPIPRDIPIYMWQYFGGPVVGWSMVNPDLLREFELRTLSLW
jgi:hypothetical protein